MELPLGLHLTRTTRLVTQAFDRALADAGGSSATWQVLVLVRSEQWGTQAQLAEAMGVTSATLTHHLNAMERRGLITRHRDESNRRVQRVALTDDGIALFDHLRATVVGFDRRLRSQLTDEDTAQLHDLLDRVTRGVAGA